MSAPQIDNNKVIIQLGQLIEPLAYGRWAKGGQQQDFNITIMETKKHAPKLAAQHSLQYNETNIYI